MASKLQPQTTFVLWIFQVYWEVLDFAREAVVMEYPVCYLYLILLWHLSVLLISLLSSQILEIHGFSIHNCCLLLLLLAGTLHPRNSIIMPLSGIKPGLSGSGRMALNSWRKPANLHHVELKPKTLSWVGSLLTPRYWLRSMRCYTS